MARLKKENNTMKYVIGASVVALLVATAAVASYMTRENMQPDRVIVKHQQTSGQGVQVARRDCDDGNIIGTIGGGIAGGALGSEVGSGRGQTAATIGGTLGGAYLGKKYIPTNNATCN